MSVNKNFVVKNGFEVSTDLILANATTKKVGIGSTNPRYKLDVAGGIGATDSYISGISTVINQFNVGTGGTIFSVLGVGGSIGIATATPAYLLDVRSPVSTGQTAIYVYGDARVTGDLIVDDDLTVDEVNTRNINVTGLSTFAGITTVTGETLFSKQLSISGVTTLGVATATNITAQNLNVSGVGTITTINSTTGTITNLSGTNVNYTGISTLTNVRSTTLVNTGVTTLGTVQISSGIITATSGVVTYYGDGQYLDNVIRGVGIGTSTGVVGYGATILNFQGPGISTITVSSGIATINITGGGSGSASIGIGTTPGSAGFTAGIVTAGNLWYNSNIGRMFIYYDDGDSKQWVDTSPFNVGIITSLVNVSFAPGSASSPSMYFVGDSQTGFFSPSAGRFTVVSSGSSILNINPSGINVTGIATASSFVGNLTGTASTASFATTSFGLSGSPNITVGNLTGVAATFSGNVSIAGTLTYEDVTNVDSVGLVTARSGVRITAGGLVVTAGVSTFNSLINAGAGLTVTGVSTFAGITTVTGETLFTKQLSVSGVTTLSNIQISSGIITTTASSFEIYKPVLFNYSEKVNVIGNTGAGCTINLANGAYVTATLNQSTTFTFTTGITTGAIGFALQLTNGTGGPYSITWPASVYWPNNTTPTRTTTDSKTDVWVFTTIDNGTKWYGNLALYNFS